MEGRSAARRLAVARLVSVAGSGAASVALAAELWRRTHDPAWVAAGALSTSLVAGLLVPFAGALVDRRDRRRVMIASDAAAAAVFAVLAALVAAEAPPAVLVAVAALAATCETPFLPASRAAIPNLVDDVDLPWANALVAQVTGLSQVIGPLTGGVLAGLLGAQTALAANAVSFLGSLALVASIAVPFGQVRAADAAAGGGVREGLAVVARDRLLVAVIASGFVAFIGVGFVIAANPALADELGAGQIGLGALWAGWGAGAIIGARLAPRLLARGAPPERWVVVGFALQGLALGAAALLPSLPAIALAQTVGGVGGGIADPARQTLIQRRTADAVRGRVFALMEAVGWCSFAVSLVLAGAFIGVVGIRGAYVVACALFLLGTALLAVLGATGARGPGRSRPLPGLTGE